MDGSNHPVTGRPIAGALGAEIHGIDLAAGLADETVAAIRRIWLEHSVVFFRGQTLPPAEFAAFARRFGEVVHYPFLKGLPEAPEVIPVAKLEHERVNFGGLWHTDTAYLEAPPMATMLIAREGAALRRRHPLRQRLRGLRGALGRHEADAGAVVGREQLREGGAHPHA